MGETAMLLQLQMANRAMNDQTGNLRSSPLILVSTMR